ncbi:MAG: hypothetical protein ACQEVA_22725, partial [Myxococcota bacterium]
IAGLDKPVKTYDSLAGDVVKSWGQIVEEPVEPKEDATPKPSDESSDLSPTSPHEPTEDSRADWAVHATFGAFILLGIAAARRRVTA